MENWQQWRDDKAKEIKNISDHNERRVQNDKDRKTEEYWKSRLHKIFKSGNFTTVSNGLERFGLSENDEPIGMGFEKVVYNHPYDNEKVVTIQHGDTRRDAKEVRDVKADFYLTKILHLLFPKNIPDIYFISTEPYMSVREKADMGKSHMLVNQSASQIRKGISKKSSVNENEAYSELRELSRDFSKRVQFTEIDEAPQNFGIDPSGNVKYVELFLARWIDGELRYNREELEKAIEEIPQKDLRQKAITYLNRLDTLDKEYRETNTVKHK